MGWDGIGGVDPVSNSSNRSTSMSRTMLFPVDIKDIETISIAVAIVVILAFALSYAV